MRSCGATPHRQQSSTPTNSGLPDLHMPRCRVDLAPQSPVPRRDAGRPTKSSRQCETFPHPDAQNINVTSNRNQRMRTMQHFSTPRCSKRQCDLQSTFTYPNAQHVKFSSNRNHSLTTMQHFHTPRCSKPPCELQLPHRHTPQMLKNSSRTPIATNT